MGTHATFQIALYQQFPLPSVTLFVIKYSRLIGIDFVHPSTLYRQNDSRVRATAESTF